MAQKTYSGLPLFELFIEDENEDGVFAVSFVDKPAIERDGMYFSKDGKKLLKFQIQDEEQRIFMGPVMIPDKPIYRTNRDEYGDIIDDELKDADGNILEEYYVTYSAETIKKCRDLMMKRQDMNNITFMHNGSLIKGVYCIGIFIKGEFGLEPEGYEDVPYDTMFEAYKTENDTLWQSVKDNISKGLSIEAYFQHRPVTMKKEEDPKLSHKQLETKIFNQIMDLYLEKCLTNQK